MPFFKKQRLFEKLSKSLEPPTAMQEARVRNQLENAYEQLKNVRQSLNRARPRPKATSGQVVKRREVRAVDLPSSPTEEEPAPEERPLNNVETDVEMEVDTSPWPSSSTEESMGEGDTSSESSTASITFPDGPYVPEDVGTFEGERLASYLNRKITAEQEDLELEKVIENISSGQANYGTYVTEVLQQNVLWTEPSPASGQDLPDKLKRHLRQEQDLLDQANLITGKERVEIAWNQLSDDWKKAFIDPITKGLKVYFDHQAVCGVPEGQWVDPHRILPSRFVLTNKGGSTLEEASLKARWVFGGHRDPDAGKYPTSSPTVSLIGHNLLNFVAVQKGWKVAYEDVSAAFLQGQELPPGREIYVKIPKGYPDEAMEQLRQWLGPNMRPDLAKLLKGGFGLPESPRLWYLEYKKTLLELGGRNFAFYLGSSSSRTRRVSSLVWHASMWMTQDMQVLQRRMPFGSLCIKDSTSARKGWQWMDGPNFVVALKGRTQRRWRCSTAWTSTASPSLLWKNVHLVMRSVRSLQWSARPLAQSLGNWLGQRVNAALTFVLGARMFSSWLVNNVPQH